MALGILPDPPKNSTTQENPPQKKQAFEPKETIDAKDVIEATDAVDFIGEYVQLRPRGGEFIGLCPMHNDSKPSFSVNPHTGIYSCWSCSAGLGESRGGDVLTFAQRYLNLSFRDALIFLARRAGMAVPETYGAKFSEIKPTPKPNPLRYPPPKSRTGMEPDLEADEQPLFSAMEKAMQTYETIFAQTPAAKTYVQSTRKLNLEKLSRFRIGFAPDDFGGLKPVFPDYKNNDDLLNAGLIRVSEKKHRYDFFRNRIIFALRDMRGRVIALGGRALPSETPSNKDAPKYINSPETSLFSKKNSLFGLFENQAQIKEQKTIMVMEGYMDVLALANAGFNNAVSCMGTSLTHQHVQKLKEYANTIILCFDGDEAGKKASLRSLEPLMAIADHCEIKICILPAGMDPDEYINHYGPESFAEQVAKAKTLEQYWASILSEVYADPQKKTIEDKLYYCQTLLGVNPKEKNPCEKAKSLMDEAISFLNNEAASPKKKADEPARNPSKFKSSATSTSFSSPSERRKDPQIRLLEAVRRCPSTAATYCTLLMQQARQVDPNHMGQAMTWLESYNKAMQEGFESKKINNSPSASSEVLRHDEAVIGACQSIFSHFIMDVMRKNLEDQHRKGLIQDQEFLKEIESQNHSKNLERPC